eukprot:365698-Chlamydomonas_euryale.AAC.4
MHGWQLSTAQLHTHVHSCSHIFPHAYESADARQRQHLRPHPRSCRCHAMPRCTQGCMVRRYVKIRTVRTT